MPVGSVETDLRDEAIVVLDATENGQRDEASRMGRWLPHLRMRVRNPVDRLRWPRAVVVPDVLADHTTDVIDAEEDELIQRLLPQRAQPEERARRERL